MDFLTTFVFCVIVYMVLIIVSMHRETNGKSAMGLIMVSLHVVTLSFVWFVPNFQ